MAAARVLPRTDLVRNISIDTSFHATPPGIIVQQGDQVNFINNSGVAITIEFAPNPPGPIVSGNIDVAAGSTNGFQAPNYDASANYYIYVGTTQQNGGPYAIQVGAGPLYVQINDSTTSPDPIAVPRGGTLEMFSTDADTYTLKWTALGNPFTQPPPGLTTVYPDLSNNVPYTETLAVAVYAYELINDGIQEGTGGGTIKVKNTQ
jgi:hypothetical protein